MMTCLTSSFARGGRPAGPLFVADEQVLAVGQLEHSLVHSSSAVCFLVSFVMNASIKIIFLYSHQLSFAYIKDVELATGKERLIVLMSDFIAWSASLFHWISWNFHHGIAAMAKISHPESRLRG